MKNRFHRPSGSVRGRKKQVIPPATFASVKKPSDCGTEQNHLWPVSSYQCAVAP